MTDIMEADIQRRLQTVASSKEAALREHEGEWFTRYRRRLLPSRRAYIIVTAILLGLWLAVVIFTALRHEYWRDEVRAWSLAREATSPLDLFHRIRYEGHPILWYLLLYIGKSIVDTPLILPITSIVIASAAVTIFMLRSPFPLWMKASFLFSALPLYVYSVKARNYGISMLLLFLAAALYRHRRKYWLRLSLVLALLANTNIHATILTSVLLAVWAWDEWSARRSAPDEMIGRPFLVAVAIVGLGILLGVIAVMPPHDTILTGFYGTTVSGLASAFLGAVSTPGAGFVHLFPRFVPVWVGSVVLYLAVFGLLRRPVLFWAALGGLVALGVLFRVAYVGYYRHAGVFLCFLVSLYWLAIEAPDSGTVRRRMLRLFHAGLYGGLFILILASVYKDRVVRVDIQSEMSSSKAFGSFLNASREFHDAILLPEPDYFIESLPYYAHNPIYFARERRFGTTVTWSTAAAVDLSLGQIVSLARKLKAQYRRPVLVVLGHPRAVTDATGDIWYLYNKHFTWTVGEHQEAAHALTPVAEFKTAAEEKYWIYAVN